MLKGLLKDKKVQLLKDYRQGNILVLLLDTGITSLEGTFILFSLYLTFSVISLAYFLSSTSVASSSMSSLSFPHLLLIPESSTKHPVGFIGLSLHLGNDLSH